jgi:hypothetical protein
LCKVFIPGGLVLGFVRKVFHRKGLNFKVFKTNQL